MSQSIPVIEARGTYREVGQQIGEKAKTQIGSMLSHLQEDLPQGVSWGDMLVGSRLYFEQSRITYPQYIEELVGIAEGAGVPFEDV